MKDVNITIIRKWNNPAISVSVSSKAIGLMLRLDAFIDAVIAQGGLDEARTKDAVNAVIEECKKTTTRFIR